MMKAQVTLKEGLSYTLGDMKFTKDKPVTVTDPNRIAELKNISVLNVAMEEDKPVVPLRKTKVVEPESEPEPEDETEDADEVVDEETEATLPSSTSATSAKPAAAPKGASGKFVGKKG